MASLDKYYLAKREQRIRNSLARCKRDRDSSRDDTVPRCGKVKQDRVNLGLAIFSAEHAMPGVCYTFQEIAEWCGCTHETIRLIQERALKKILATAKEDPALQSFIEALRDKDNDRQPAKRKSSAVF